MKRLAGLLVVLVLAAPAAEAAVKLPKPIDSPVVRPKDRHDHKPGKRAGDHRARYQRKEWGNEWNQTLSVRRPKAMLPWLTQD